jgi:hypothetical protein
MRAVLPVSLPAKIYSTPVSFAGLLVCCRFGCGHEERDVAVSRLRLQEIERGRHEQVDADRECSFVDIEGRAVMGVRLWFALYLRAKTEVAPGHGA